MGTQTLFARSDLRYTVTQIAEACGRTTVRRLSEHMVSCAQRYELHP